MNTQILRNLSFWNSHSLTTQSIFLIICSHWGKTVTLFRIQHHYKTLTYFFVISFLNKNIQVDMRKSRQNYVSYARHLNLLPTKFNCLPTSLKIKNCGYLKFLLNKFYFSCFNSYIIQIWNGWISQILLELIGFFSEKLLFPEALLRSQQNPP